MGEVTAAFLSDVESPICCSSPLPLPSRFLLNFHTALPYLGNKDLTSVIVVQCLVADHLPETFPTHL